MRTTRPKIGLLKPIFGKSVSIKPIGYSQLLDRFCGFDIIETRWRCAARAGPPKNSTESSSWPDVTSVL